MADKMVKVSEDFLVQLLKGNWEVIKSYINSSDTTLAGNVADKLNALIEADKTLQANIDTAQSTAETAQSTAEDAANTAANAKSTADTAKTTADGIKATADDAKTAADAATKAINDANVSELSKIVSTLKTDMDDIYDWASAYSGIDIQYISDNIWYGEDAYNSVYSIWTDLYALQTAMAKKAPTESPTFTGTVTIPNTTNYTNTTGAKIAINRDTLYNILIGGYADFGNIDAHVTNTYSIGTSEKTFWKSMNAMTIGNTNAGELKTYSVGAQFSRNLNNTEYLAYIGANLYNVYTYGGNTTKNQLVLGHYVSAINSGELSGTSGNALVIGAGTSTLARNALEIDYSGNVYAMGKFYAEGCDYAEYFEWEDGNVNNDDRVGRFVKLNGDKITFAEDQHEVLGVISATPTVIGNDDMHSWKKMYMTDDYGRVIVETAQEVVGYDENGKPIIKDIDAPKINPEYDTSKTYISRGLRHEWAVVGLMGQLLVADDGTCEVNGYCKPSIGGVATKADLSEKMLITDRLFKVMKRVTDNIIQIMVI